MAHNHAKEMDVASKIKQEATDEVENLKHQLKIKENELKEEMDDRDKAEDRVLKLTESLASKEKDLDGLRNEIEELKRASSDVPRLLQAFNNADRSAAGSGGYGRDGIRITRQHSGSTRTA